jgi:UDP-N-acetylmuramoyl-tripeptide--D-alanyl-D-alanine ligase
MGLTLADVIEGIGGKRIDLSAAPRVREFVIDSREVQRGDVFIAFKGERVDGHDFVQSAFERGAVAAMVDKSQVGRLEGMNVETVEPSSLPAFQPSNLSTPILVAVDNTEQGLQKLATWWRNKFNVRVIGVTGSVGKTTTKEVISQVLSVKYDVLKSEGNLNNALGVPLTLLKIESRHTHAVLEMGMDRLGEIAAYCEWTTPSVGVITMIAPVHLSKLGTMANIVRAKTELLAALPSAEQGGVAILNDDDERVRGMASQTKARVVTYGLSSRANVWASDVESYGLDGISFTLKHGSKTTRVHAPLLGQHSVQTALRAATVGLVEGMTLEEAVEGLSLQAPQLRIVMATGPHDSLVIDDSYNAAPESTLAALNLLKEINGSAPRIAVLGDMLELGDAEQIGHEEVGCRAALVADVIIGVGQRSRFMCRAAVECGAEKERVFHVESNGEAIMLLNEILTKKHIVLVKGSRGMKMEEIVNALGALVEESKW